MADKIILLSHNHYSTGTGILQHLNNDFLEMFTSFCCFFLFFVYNTV